MCISTLLLIFTFLYSCHGYAMDDDNENISTTKTPKDLSNKTISLNRHSAPNTSTDKKPLFEKTLNNNDDNDSDNKKQKATKKMSISLPSIKKPAWTSVLTEKTDHFITPARIDDGVWKCLKEGHDIVVKIAEKEPSITQSQFYHVLENMQQSSLQGDAYSFAFANFFLFSLLETDNFKLLLNPGSSYIRGDYTLCIDTIKEKIAILTQRTIEWPSTSRQEDEKTYYKELLEKNKNIDTSLIKSPYIGSCITIYFLPQLIERSPQHKAIIQKLLKKPDDITKLKKTIHQLLIAQSIFVDKNMVQSTPKQQKKMATDD